MVYAVQTPVCVPYDQDDFGESLRNPPPYTLLPQHRESPQPEALPLQALSIDPASSVPGAFSSSDPPVMWNAQPSQTAAPHDNPADNTNTSRRARSPAGVQYREPQINAASTHSTGDAVLSRQQGAENLEQIYIAVMGVTGAGKSKFISLCTQKSDVQVGHGLESCTKDVNEYSFTYRDKLVHLIDTPGFDDTNRSDRQVLDDIATWLGNAYMQNIKLTGIIYLHRITDPRMTDVALSNLVMFKKLCGEDFYPRVVLVTTMWDIEKKKTAESREKELLGKDEILGNDGQGWLHP